MQANVLEWILAVNSNALKMGNQSTNTKSLHLLMSKTDCGIFKHYIGRLLTGFLSCICCSRYPLLEFPIICRSFLSIRKATDVWKLQKLLFM